MQKKLIGIIVCTLLITTVLPTTGVVVKNKVENLSFDVFDNQYNPGSLVDEWPMFQHDLQRTGYSTSKGPVINNIKWVFHIEASCGSSVDSSPAVANGRIYIGTDTSLPSQFYCLDAETGELIWQTDIPGGVSVSSPAVVDGKVYQGSTYDYVYCFDADTGETLWTYDKGYGISRSPAIVNSKVYITKCKGQLYCLDANTGDELWKYDMGEYELSPPTVYEDKVYIGSEDYYLYCFNADTGSLLWRYNTGWKVLLLGAPSIFNGNVICGGRDTFCLDAETGDVIWNFEVVGCTSAVAYGNVYLHGYNPHGLYCLDADTGEQIWFYPTGPPYTSSPAIADNKVYLGLWDIGRLICLDAATGELIWYGEIGSPKWFFNSPAIAYGRLYIGGGPTLNVYCFEDPSQPPYPPAIEGPNIGAIGIEYDFSIVANDPDGDDVRYKVEWGDGTTTWWIGPYPCGEKIIVSHKWSKLGTFDIRVRTKDIYGMKSDWSEIHPISIIEDEPPSAPNISGRTSGESGVYYHYSFNSTDPDGDDVSYYIKWGDGYITDWTALQASGIPFSDGHRWIVNGNYTIEAKAKDIYGAESEWAALNITIPRTRTWLRFFDIFPILQRLLGFIK